MQEFDALVANGTWELVPPPASYKVVPCKWVHRVKFLGTDELDKYKAHLVAKELLQIEDLEYIETFSPVIKFTMVRAILTLALNFD